MWNVFKTHKRIQRESWVKAAQERQMSSDEFAEALVLSAQSTDEETTVVLGPVPAFKLDSLYDDLSRSLTAFTSEFKRLDAEIKTFNDKIAEEATKQKEIEKMIQSVEAAMLVIKEPAPTGEDLTATVVERAQKLVAFKDDDDEKGKVGNIGYYL